MSDDIVIVIALTLGMVFALTRIVARRLPDRLTRQVTFWAVAVPVGALAADALTNLDDPFGHRADLGATAALGFMMLVPIWGFFDERLLERIDDLAVATITLVFVYRGEMSTVLSVAVGAVGVALTVLLRRLDGTWWWGLVAYLWFLGCALGLALIEFERVKEPLLGTIDELPSFWMLATSGAAVLYLSFHAWFSLRFVLIVTTLVRPIGRYHARAFVSRSVDATKVPSATFAGILVAVGTVFWFDRWLGLGGDRFVGGLAVFAVPMIHAVVELVVGTSKTGANPESMMPQITATRADSTN